MIGSFWGFFGVTAILKAYDGLHQIDQNSLWGDCRRKPQAFGFREFGTKWKAGGGPAAGYFFCLPKRSNQENAPTLRPDRFGCGNLVSRKPGWLEATRRMASPQGAEQDVRHKLILAQCSLPPSWGSPYGQSLRSCANRSSWRFVGPQRQHKVLFPPPNRGLACGPFRTQGAPSR